MYTTVCCSFKGGTAKTSTVLHLGVVLAKKYKKRVLLIDFDAQANLTTGLGFSPDQEKTMVQVLQGQLKMQDIIEKSRISGLDIATANVFLDGVEATSPIVNDLYGHERLRNAIKDLDYDFVFIDTPPSLGWLTQSAFFAATHSLICSVPEPYSILALNRLRDYHEQIRSNHELDILGVVLSFWDERGATNNAYVKAIEEAFENKLFDTRVRRDIAVSRSVLLAKTVIEAYPRSRASYDYERLGAEFMKRVSNGSSSQKKSKAERVVCPK